MKSYQTMQSNGAKQTRQFLAEQYVKQIKAGFTTYAQLEMDLLIARHKNIKILIIIRKILNIRTPFPDYQLYAITPKQRAKREAKLKGF